MTPYDATPPQAPRRAGPAPLIDGFGRTVTYLRVSVTDRCDLRCVYCMAEHMVFLPLVRQLARHLDSRALDELTLTTNGTRLAEFAGELADAGVRRINVSLD